MKNNQTQNSDILSKTPQLLLQLTPQQLLNEQRKRIKRTKTVCTIGPSCQSVEKLLGLIDQGMNVARLNFSHGTHEEHQRRLQGIYQAMKMRPKSSVSILLDTKGPEIRTGKNLNEEIIKLKKGQFLQITTDYLHPCNSQRIACSYKDLPKMVDIGKKILFADGSISTTVVKIEGQIVTVQVQNDGSLGSKKNMCLPGTVINLPTIGPLDEHDIINFGLKHKVNFIAVSFARYKADLDNLRKLLIEKDPEHGPYIQIISKIQNHEGVLNLHDLIQGSDGIMVARGDLGMEVPLQKVVLLQKFIIQSTINAGKFVITATQMLESMQSKPRPTRAQVSDITNSVLDLTDANMTSGQTANGEFPIQAAKYLRLISEQAQGVCDYKQIFCLRKNKIKCNRYIPIVSLTFQLGSHFIFIKTDNVDLIHQVSSLRPESYIIIFSKDQKVKKAVSADFGVYIEERFEMIDGSGFWEEYRGFYAGSTEEISILKVQLIDQEISGFSIIKLKRQ